MISKESLEKFKELYRKRFNEELNDEEVLRQATRLLNLYRAVYFPLPYHQINNEYKQKSEQFKK